MKILRYSIAAILLSSTTAFAAPCSLNGVTVNLYGNANACAGTFSGNDTGNNSTFLADLNAGSIFTGFGAGDLGLNWTLLGKSDGSSTNVTADNNQLTGSWSASGVGTHTVVTLKGSTSFSAFLFTPLTLANIAGAFDMDAGGVTTKNGKNVAALSHLSVFIAGPNNNNPPQPPEPVPLPAAGWMLLAGLSGMVAMRRRK